MQAETLAGPRVIYKADALFKQVKKAYKVSLAAAYEGKLVYISRAEYISRPDKNFFLFFLYTSACWWLLYVIKCLLFYHFPLAL